MLIAVLIAIGGAFVTEAKEVGNSSVTRASGDEASMLASYRTIPTDPSTCTTFGTVDCNTNPINPACIVNVNGQPKQLYDAGDCSQQLYYDPVQ